MRKLNWLSWLLVLVLLLTSVPVFAAENVQEKSWDINGDRLYGIDAENNGDLIAFAESKDVFFSIINVIGTDGFFSEDMRGSWSIEHLAGDAVDFNIATEGDEEEGLAAFGCLFLTAGEVGQEALFQVRYVSSDLKNPVSKRLSVHVVSESEAASDYVYDKTEHTIKAESHFELPGGKVLPEGADYIKGFEWNADAFYEVGGWVEIEHDTGIIRGWVPTPGVYELPVTVHLTSRENDVKEILHTITVTEYLPDFKLNYEDLELERFIHKDADEWGITDIRLEDQDRREEDEFEWSWVQVSGAEAPLRFEERENEPWCVFPLIMGPETDEGRGTIAEGKYKYTITLKDITRDESASVSITVNVRHINKEVQLSGIDYPSFKQASTITIKAGQTLKFGKPKLLPSDVSIAEDTYYGIWIEDLDWELERRMKFEDAISGEHKIVGVKEGEYTVHYFVNMYDDSWGAETIFNLVVLPPAKPAQSITISPAGDWDNPVQIPIGGKYKLKATVLPKNAGNKSVTWVSDNDYEISVDKNGFVTINVLWSMGQIYAYTNDGSDLVDSVVVQFVYPKITKVTLSKKKLTLKVGDTKNLTATLKPKNLPDELYDLLWVSDNSEVVEVMRYSRTGELTALKPGKATIYAYVRDENEEGGVSKKVFGKCVVTVK